METCVDSAGNVTTVCCRPLSEEELLYEEAEVNDLLAESGVPARPRGRIWLLRPPEGFTSLAAVLGHLLAAADKHGVRQACCSEFVQLSHAELRHLFQLS
ncbi:hypothetical protein GL263_18710 [Streptomyces durbertensis]|uniref:Uncharacterized protein n=2 Tax=Streptomyces durbertensis TaxID=2448886 RepID=A0ABR6EJY1_9ACTN|nr:hypothetical protein [Streptomyces durbertensis]